MPRCFLICHSMVTYLGGWASVHAHQDAPACRWWHQPEAARTVVSVTREPQQLMQGSNHADAPAAGAGCASRAHGGRSGDALGCQHFQLTEALLEATDACEPGVTTCGVESHAESAHLPTTGDNDTVSSNGNSKHGPINGKFSTKL